jgi:hypothetical protein
MLPPVFQTLKASAAVKAIVGTNPPRIYRHGTAPQNGDKPYITWQLVSGVPENNLSDPPPVDRQSVQVDCWHQTDAGIEVLADAVRDAIEPVAHMTSAFNDSRETETKLFRIGLNFDFFGR